MKISILTYIYIYISFITNNIKTNNLIYIINMLFVYEYFYLRKNDINYDCNCLFFYV